MKLLGFTKKDVGSDKNNEKIPKLESIDVDLVHRNLVKNDYQHQKFDLVLFQKIWTTNEYFNPFFKNDEYS